MQLFQPWQFKHDTVERGNVWKAIAESLISLGQSKFKQIDDRAVRDHYRTLEKKHKKKTSSEKKASGVSPEENEVDTAMEDIIQRFEEADKRHQQIADEKREQMTLENCTSPRNEKAITGKFWRNQKYIYSSKTNFLYYLLQTRKLGLRFWSFFSQTRVRNQVTMATA